MSFNYCDSVFYERVICVREPLGTRYYCPEEHLCEPKYCHLNKSNEKYTYTNK